ncbi:hypothetical protein CLM82_24295, partial [Streptomyces albidoflavus]
MKILSKQPVPEPAPEAGDEAAIDARDDAYELGGWSTGAQANTTTLVRWVAWAAICGSILLSLGTFLSRPADTPSTDQQPPAGTGAQGAAGFATLYASEYLLAGKGDEGRLAAYYPGAATLRLEGSRGRLTPSQLTVTRLRQTGPDIWSVTVAARLQPPSPPVENDDAKEGDSPDPDTGAGQPPQGESVRSRRGRAGRHRGSAPGALRDGDLGPPRLRRCHAPGGVHSAGLGDRLRRRTPAQAYGP